MRLEVSRKRTNIGAKRTEGLLTRQVVLLEDAQRLLQARDGLVRLTCKSNRRTGESAYDAMRGKRYHACDGEIHGINTQQVFYFLLIYIYCTRERKAFVFRVSVAKP